MPVYELMRKNERVTLMALNQSGGIEKCDYKNINRRIAPLQEQICVDGIQRWWGKRAVPLNQGKIGYIRRSDFDESFSEISLNIG